MSLKAPLAIHVIMHKNFEAQEQYKESLYSTFNRNTKQYLERCLNIPIYFYTKNPVIIDKYKYEKNFVVIVIDKQMLFDRDFKLSNIIEDRELTIRTIALTQNAYKKADFFARYNFIRAYEKRDNQLENILFELAHDIGSLLLEKKNLKLFLSHAKNDGLEIALEFKKYIEVETKLDNFFDVNSIKNADDWRDIIREGVEESGILIFQTDEYSSREWCRQEVLMAKKSNVPIVAIDCLKKFEKRSFPYMANIPRVKLNNNYKDIVYQLLLETIRLYYQSRFIKYMMSLFFKEHSPTIFSSSPELLTLVYRQDEPNNTIIYPDPPLGNEELRVLESFNSSYSFYTPLTFVTKEINLKDLNIDISVSESNNIEECEISHIHLVDFIIELSRYLLATDTTLLYGGDIRYEDRLNFTKIIADLTKTYQQDYKRHIAIKNYMSYNFYIKPYEELKEEFFNIVEFIEVKPDENFDIQNRDKMYQRYIISETLSKMRKKMTQEMDIRIVAGAKIEGFLGKYSGVLEETYMALEAKKPVFIIGAFCGVAGKIIDALQGEQPKEFTLDYHLKNASFKSLYEYYQSIGEEKIFCYNIMLESLNSWGVEGLNNGLSVEENKILFTSQNIYEIIYLILKGIRIVSEKNKKG